MRVAMRICSYLPLITAKPLLPLCSIIYLYINMIYSVTKSQGVFLGCIFTIPVLAKNQGVKVVF